MPSAPAAASPAGLLYSQIGYDTHQPKRALFRAPPGTRWTDATFALRRYEQTVRGGPLQPWGRCWGSDWWVADFSAVDEPGEYALEVVGPDGPLPPARVRIGLRRLFEATWKATSIEQAERRQRLANGALGWYDAGTHWQEANSHAAFILGLAELREHRAADLSADDTARLDRQLINGCDYLASLQEMATAQGAAAGALVHQSFKFEKVILPADAAKAAAAWARVSRLLAPSAPEKAADYADRAQRALRWLEQPEHLASVPYNPAAYGEELPRPAGEPGTPDLLLVLAAELDLGWARAEPSPTLVRHARCLLRRQRAAPAADGAPAGLFGVLAADGATTKAWTHGLPTDGWFSADVGGTFGLHLLPLVALLQRYPHHGDAAGWQEALHRFAYGYFAPACEANPFLLCPNGHFPGQGLLWFAGLWHGGTTMYGLAAALALEFARLFQDTRFTAIATGNLQWVAGLNAGLTRESLAGCHMFSVEIPPGVACPVSLINGIGERTAGTWLNIRGAICNGFGTGDQFQWDVPPRAEHDAPSALHDEDWITHAGAWLTALARL